MFKPITMQLTVPVETEIDVCINDFIVVPSWIAPLETDCPICGAAFDSPEGVDFVCAAETPVGPLFFHTYCLASENESNE